MRIGRLDTKDLQKLSHAQRFNFWSGFGYGALAILMIFVRNRVVIAIVVLPTAVTMLILSRRAFWADYLDAKREVDLEKDRRLKESR